MIMFHALAAAFALSALAQLSVALSDYRNGTSRFRLVQFVERSGHPIARQDRPKMFFYALIWNALTGIALAIAAIWMLLAAFAWNAK